jgi:hypothetical protein
VRNAAGSKFKTMKTIILFLLAACMASFGQNIRVVDGRAYDSSHWKDFGGDTGAFIKVLQDSTNGTICESYQARSTHALDGSLQFQHMHIGYFVVKNYPHPEELITDKILIACRALESGRMQTAYGTLPVFDCGTAYVPPPLTPEQIEAAKQTALVKKAAEKKKAAAGAAKALESNQAAAEKGDAYGLLRMGERYRDGEGVEKDLTKAKDFLTRAAAAGSPTAAQELSALK